MEDDDKRIEEEEEIQGGEKFEPPPAAFHHYLAEMTNGESGSMEEEEEEEELLVDDAVDDIDGVDEEEKDKSYGMESPAQAQAEGGSALSRGLMATPLPVSYRKESDAAAVLSPFSPTTEGRQRRQRLLEEDGSGEDWTLSKSRRVSILVKVGNHDASSSSLCLLPLIHDHQTHQQNNQNSPNTSPASRTLQLANDRNTKELVLVNPDAFGSLIPAEVTVETARLVAQISHVASEDWARRYHFDH
eukprot:2583976-Ditylum_brightwellii.AAC.1